MATPESKAFAKQLVKEKLTGTGAGAYWPKLREEQVAAGLIERVDDPDVMYQSASNICGMASFAHDLVETDPVLYVWLGIYLFKQGHGRLGRGPESIEVFASPETRNSPLPNQMNHADWVVMASLRDHSNKVLRYRYNAKIPILGDIPILGPLFSSWMAEPIAGINWPDDLVTLLKASGFTKVVNAADVRTLAGLKNLILSGDYYAAGYQVMLLIHTNMLEGGSPAPIANHWVTLESTIDENMFAFEGPPPAKTAMPGVAFTIFNPASKERTTVPKPPAKYILQSLVVNNYFGFVAARQK